VFASKIADLRSSSRISCPQLGKYQVFLGMMINFWVDFEVTDNRVNDLIVSTVAPAENLEFPLKDGKQLLNVEMLLG
jgi:hypothetical protein